MEQLLQFIRLARLPFIVGAMLLFGLGAGVARFLGASIDWNLYLIGQAWVSLVQLSTHFLNEYYDAPMDEHNPNRTPFSGGSGALGPGKLRREVALWSGISCLTIAASLTVLLIRMAAPDGGLIMILALIFLGAFFYSTPPVRLASTGYGELTTSIIVANLVPALSFMLQYGELHRLLAMATFPLTLLHLAMMLAYEFPDYASDFKYQKQTLLVRMGWERGMLMHNLLILVSFLVLGTAAILGLPLAIALPGFLSLPLGLFQIWMMNRIGDGARPNWPALTFTAAALLGITVYLLMFAFWTR